MSIESIPINHTTQFFHLKLLFKDLIFLHFWPRALRSIHISSLLRICVGNSYRGQCSRRVRSNKILSPFLRLDSYYRAKVLDSHDCHDDCKDVPIMISAISAYRHFFPISAYLWSFYNWKYRRIGISAMINIGVSAYRQKTNIGTSLDDWCATVDNHLSVVTTSLLQGVLISINFQRGSPQIWIQSTWQGWQTGKCSSFYGQLICFVCSLHAKYQMIFLIQSKVW